MASEFQGPVITKQRGGLNRRVATTDGIFGLVCGGVAVAGKIALGQIVKLTQVKDAEDLGLNAAYDATNKVLVYNHILEYFTLDPNGTLYLMLVAKGTTLAQMCDKTLAYGYKLMTDESTNREIKKLGVVLNPATGYTPTHANGFDADVLAAVVKAQEMAVDLRGRAIYLDNILLEGRLNPSAAISTFKNLRTLASEYVSVVSAQDPVVASLDALYARYGAVGAALGMLSVRKVSECIGSVDIINKPESAKGTDTYSLTNKSTGRWLSAALSNGKKYSELTETDKATLASIGLIYVGKYEGFDGYYFSDSHTCVSVTDDYAYIEDNAVWNKAVRLLRPALIPIMKGTVDIDPNTGFISASQIAGYEAKGERAVKAMTTSGEIAGNPKVVIAPDQDVVGTGKVDMSLQYVRKGILRQLSATVGAVNPALN